MVPLMPSIDPLSDRIPQEFESNFWKLVSDALSEVLGVDGDLAQQYRAQLEGASARERLLALHDDPIDVAATIAGISLTREHLSQYDSLRNRLEYRWDMKDLVELGSEMSGLTRFSQRPAPRRVRQMGVGESLVGDGNEVAHIDLIIGPRGSAAEVAFANCLTNNKDGFTSLLALLAPNLMVKPATVLFNKVTIKGAKQAVQMFGPAQHAVAKAVADSVAEGVIPQDEADDLFVCVGVFIHWEAADDKKIQDFNYRATKEPIARAVNGEPKAADVVAKRNQIKHPFAAA
jgi:5,6,7,8-tetrahydromethanopterin hydro-lyase